MWCPETTGEGSRGFVGTSSVGVSTRLRFGKVVLQTK